MKSDVSSMSDRATFELHLAQRSTYRD